MHRNIFVFIITLLILFVHLDASGMPKAVPEFPHPKISGHLKSKSKKCSTAFQKLSFTISGVNIQLSRLHAQTDVNGYFCLPLQNANGDINIIISMPEVKEKDAEKYYVTIDPMMGETVLQTDTVFNSFVHYNIDSIVDSLYERGERMPYFLDWLFKYDKNFQGDCDRLEPPPYNKGFKEKSGPYYKSRPMIWIVDGWYWTTTGGWNTAIRYKGKDKSEYGRNDIRYPIYNYDTHLLLKLDEVQDVYVSTKPNVWKPWFIYDNLEIMNPVTVAIYLHSKGVNVKNKIRNIHLKII